MASLRLCARLAGVLIPLLLITPTAQAQHAPGTTPFFGTPVGSRPDIGSDYFQQGVHYVIDVTLDADADTISGRETLTYTNNSADTLDVVYFHLYQNAFQTGSYYDHRLRGQGDMTLRNLPEARWGGTELRDLRDGLDRPLRSERDDTILKVRLNDPLAPGDRAEFRMEFTTRFGTHKRRMKAGDDYYIAAHWYPRMVVYDVRRGWNLDYHLGREFYGDFGTYQWSLTLPAHFIVEGTGHLKNRAELLPPDLMEKLDLTHFADKPIGSKADVVIEPTDETKTWRFLAQNVHDIAWIASPNFRIGEAEWEGIKIYAVAREQHAAGWQDAAEVGAVFIADYSKRWGHYPYHKMIVSDVESGMEYPMLTADAGVSPDYIGLLGHEIAHNWFYGVIGSNETYRALLDEGFTNYITAVAMDSAWGEGSATMYEGWYARHFYPRVSRKYYRNDFRYLRFARAGYEIDPLNTHSDHFHEYQNYRLVYSKTTEMLYGLEYVLGDDVFRDVIRAYYSRFQFQHPYPEDFIRVAEEVSGRDLEWFFHEWLDTTHTIDYALDDLENLRDGDGWIARIALRRKAEMPMPLDLELILANGDTLMVLVPTDHDQRKPTNGWIATRPWIGWGRVHDRFTVDVPAPHRVKQVTIDPSGRLADIDRLDNVSGLVPPIRLRFDNMNVHYPSLDRYDMWFRPSVRWNGVDGVQVGLHGFSGYMLTDFTRQAHVRGGARYGERSGDPSFQMFAETPFKPLGRLTHVFARAEHANGRRLYEAGVTGVLRERLYEKPLHRFDFRLRHSRFLNHDYEPRHGVWELGRVRLVEAGYGYEWERPDGSNRIDVGFRATSFDSHHAFWDVKLVSRRVFKGGLPVRTRFYVAAQGGSPPEQFALRPGGATAFDAARRHWLFAARGSLPEDVADGHLHVGGGPNLRGFVGSGYRFDRVVAANMEIPDGGFFARFINPFRSPRYDPPLDVYLFGDCAVMGDIFHDDQPMRFMADGGVGANLRLPFIPKDLGSYSVRCDLPVAIVDCVETETKWVGGDRWVMGIGRAW